MGVLESWRRNREERWRLRNFGWTILAIGIMSFVLIPYLLWAERDGEVSGAIVVGIVGIALGFVIVTFLTKPIKR